MKKNFRKVSSLSLAILLASSRPSLGEGASFKDVARDAWFYEPVMSLVDLGHIRGYEDSSFRPQKEISLGEFLQLLMTATTGRTYGRIEGRHWAYDAYMDAVVKALIDSSNFGASSQSLDAPLSREDMAYILVGASENILGEETGSLEGLEAEIRDLDRADPLKRDSILASYSKGLLAGRSGKFEPKARLTRAEAAAVVMRLLEPDLRLDIKK